MIGSVLVFVEMFEEIRRCFTEVESCFRLLLFFDLVSSSGVVVFVVVFSVFAEGRFY